MYFSLIDKPYPSILFVADSSANVGEISAARCMANTASHWLISLLQTFTYIYLQFQNATRLEGPKQVSNLFKSAIFVCQYLY